MEQLWNKPSLHLRGSPRLWSSLWRDTFLWRSVELSSLTREGDTSNFPSYHHYSTAAMNNSSWQTHYAGFASEWIFNDQSLKEIHFKQFHLLLFLPGESFKAHRLVLAACSAHFSKLFSNSTLNGQLIVILEGTHHQDLQILLQFMYKGVAYLHQDRIESVLRTAEVLQVAEEQSYPLISLQSFKRISPALRKCWKSLMDIAKPFKSQFVDFFLFIKWMKVSSKMI